MTEENKEDFWDLIFHDPYSSITRYKVPGGWIYKTEIIFKGNLSASTCFVPELSHTEELLNKINHLETVISKLLNGMTAPIQPMIHPRQELKFCPHGNPILQNSINCTACY